MKIGLAIAPENASPSSFVVFRDKLSVCVEKAAHLGYDGVELALADPAELDVAKMERLLARFGLELAVISTGRVFAERHLWFTHPDAEVRARAVTTLTGLARCATHFGAKVNIGRLRGFIDGSDGRKAAEHLFVDCMRKCADEAAGLGVELLLEPVNRYEIDYINSVPEALDAIAKIDRPNVKVMPDVFHMNIEDVSIVESLRAAGSHLGYIHWADSNRRAPGQGHLDFGAIRRALNDIAYDWYVTAEILPYPDPDTAAAQAAEYMRHEFSEF